ncbi:hypothetical protein [Methylovulum psychrotolerans]|uniref:Uncharacterized protein n=1 Tax=Methylovulum psychrotolerans TaxID=1704499 RepID=A0A2S5CIH0_9GAMM|nr:hypothetical protein [Methylovulum psychrotolerans]POZ50610.1 hypothetical protein AADEFJLK_03503 [Methylovulum psychrotolerans]
MEQQSINNEEISWIQLKCAQLKYVFHTDKTPIIVTLAFIVWVIIDYSSGWKVADDFKTLWNSDLDQIVSSATLVVALFVWHGEISNNWKQNLPKRLTVEFKNPQEELVLLCINAYLSHDADIRNLGQQIGGQMCDNDRFLHLRAALIDHDTGRIAYSSETGHYLHYKVTFIFTQLPEALKNLPEGKCKKWVFPFESQNMEIVERTSCLNY